MPATTTKWRKVKPAVLFNSRLQADRPPAAGANLQYQRWKPANDSPNRQHGSLAAFGTQIEAFAPRGAVLGPSVH